MAGLPLDFLVKRANSSRAPWATDKISPCVLPGEFNLWLRRSEMGSSENVLIRQCTAVLLVQLDLTGKWKCRHFWVPSSFYEKLSLNRDVKIAFHVWAVLHVFKKNVEKWKYTLFNTIFKNIEIWFQPIATNGDMAQQAASIIWNSCDLFCCCVICGRTSPNLPHFLSMELLWRSCQLSMSKALPG